MEILEPKKTLNSRVWGPWSTAGFGLVVGIVIFITQLIVTGAFLVVRIVSEPALSLLQLIETLSNDGLFLAISTFMNAVVCVGLIAIFVKIRRGATIVEYLSLRAITRKTILVSLVITVGLILLSGCLRLILVKSPNLQFMVDAYNTSVWPALLWVAMVIFAPAFEEIFFRGFLFAGFRQSRLGAVGTIVLTAFLWALLHIQYEVYEIAIIFVIGIVLGIMRFKTDSLWSPLLMHAFFNLIAMLGVAINVNSLIS